MSQENKKNIDISMFRRTPSDTGSSEVQIAQASQRVRQLTEHLKKHKKDFHTRLGLVKIISARKRHLSYLKNNNFENYQKVIQQLGLRK